MAGSLVQVGSDNKIRISSDSKIVVGGASDPCCCTTTGVACGSCTGSTPAQFNVFFSGMTECTACTTLGGNFAKITSGTLNGSTFTVEQTADPCVFEYIEEPLTTLAASFFTNSGCTTGTTAYSRMRITYVLSNALATRLLVSLEDATPSIFTTAKLFSVASGPIIVCAASATWTNGATACGVNGSIGVFIAYGGTADTVAV